MQKLEKQVIDLYILTYTNPNMINDRKKINASYQGVQLELKCVYTVFILVE